MTKIDWQPSWTSQFGGISSDYYRILYEKSGQRPYLDASYWVWWEQWFEKEVNGKFVRIRTYSVTGKGYCPIVGIEFENESDATLFRLRCP